MGPDPFFAAAGDWKGVFERITEEVKTLLASRAK
jgi:hypothetical protein